MIVRVACVSVWNFEKMADPFLEREKELMKLNDTLNNKMSFDLKPSKAPINPKSMGKMKKIATTNKTVRCDAIQPKNAIKDTKKFKTDNSCDVKKPVFTTYTPEKCDETHELDSKDAAFNPASHRIDDSSHKQCNNTTKTIINSNSNDKQSTATAAAAVSGDKISNALIECIEKTIDNKSSSNVNLLSLIPAHVIRKNISTDGIIK